MKIAVIPARGGSKRIPRKNIKAFNGKPMIRWAIETAIKSQCFDKIIVSTDDAEIQEVALASGAEVPFTRPESISDDYTATLPVIKHAIEWCLTEGLNLEYICCIYATTPLLIAEDLSLGLKKLIEDKSNYAFSITSFPFPIQRALKLDANDRPEMFYPEHMMTRSQDLEESWHDAGFGPAVGYPEPQGIAVTDAGVVVRGSFLVFETSRGDLTEASAELRDTAGNLIATLDTDPDSGASLGRAGEAFRRGQFAPGDVSRLAERVEQAESEYPQEARADRVEVGLRPRRADPALGHRLADPSREVPVVVEPERLVDVQL